MVTTIWVTDRFYVVNKYPEVIVILFNIYSWRQRHVQFKLIISLQQKAEDAEVFCGWLTNKITNKKQPIRMWRFVCLLLRILVWADNSPTGAISCLGTVSGKNTGEFTLLKKILSFCQLTTVPHTVYLLWLGTVTVKISTEYAYWMHDACQRAVLINQPSVRYIYRD